MIELLSPAGDIEKLRKIAKNNNLLVTAGSDFHGPISTPDVEIGTGRNNNIVTDIPNMLEIMKEYIKKYRLHFLFVAGLAVLSAVATVGISLVLQYAIDISLKGQIKEAVIITIIFIVCFGAIYYLASAGQVSLNQRLMEVVRGNIIQKLLQVGCSSLEMKMK